jgi:hypothetical protein
LAVEPTALVALGLLAAQDEANGQRTLTKARAAAAWLAGLQDGDGSLGVSAELREPGWPTPYAILLWAALSMYPAERQRAVSWLLAQEGTTTERRDDGVIGHDPSISGWPWKSGTHSWVEPTAFAVLALRRAGLHQHPRVREGVRLLYDRAVPSGGWNYGNRVVFGRTLRAQPGPTGLALLALAGTAGSSQIPVQAIEYLRSALATTRAPLSLAWGVLGLRAWCAEPAAALDWLGESAAHALTANADWQLGLLLLAAGNKSLELLGATG